LLSKVLREEFNAEALRGPGPYRCREQRGGPWDHTHSTFSRERGRMKMAIGCRWAACSRRTALAETSRMQCFPWGAGRVGGGGPAGSRKGQTEVPGKAQDTERWGGKLAKGEET
jgi:hypothetical protein